jgi:hypothetical protein
MRRPRQAPSTQQADSSITGAMKQDPAHYGFRCPNLECGAEYVALAKDCAPAQKPRCVECATPFLVKDKGRFLHYQALRFD